MNIKLINLVQILEGKTCISPVDSTTSSAMCTSIECNSCPANVRDADPSLLRARAIRGIIDEQGVE